MAGSAADRCAGNASSRTNSRTILMSVIADLLHEFGYLRQQAGPDAFFGVIARRVATQHEILVDELETGDEIVTGLISFWRDQLLAARQHVGIGGFVEAEMLGPKLGVVLRDWLHLEVKQQNLDEDD